MADIQVTLEESNPILVTIDKTGPAGGGGGGGAVDSVNGQTGVVELDATDIPYDPEYADTISYGYWTPTTDYENTQAFVDRFVEGFVGLGTQVAGFSDAINSLMTDGPAVISRRINKVAHGVTSKQVVRLTGGSESGAGYYVGSDCTSLENSQVDGMVWAVQDDDNFTLMLAGYRDEFSGYTPPNIYYLSETPGVLSDTPPTTPGHVVKAVAKAVGSTRLLFFPNSPCYIIGEDGVTWGDISGDITDQADLQTALSQVLTDANDYTDTATSDLVPNIRTVNGHALSSDVTVSKSDVGLGNVTNDAQLKIASNLSEINTTNNKRSARYNIGITNATAVCAYLTNISLSGAPPTTDGVTPTNGDTVLLVGQTIPSQNGLWTVDTSTNWTRPNNFPSAGSIGSTSVHISSGTILANSIWGLAAPSSITIDTTAQAWNLIANPAGTFSALKPTSGDWYSLGGQSAASAPGLTSAGKLVAHPLWLHPGPLNAIAVSSSVAAASLWRLGLYKANPFTDLCDGQTPFLDAGTVDMNNTAGLQAITISKDILVPGWYWASILVDSYTAQPTTHNVTYSSNSGIGVPGLPQDMSSFGRYRVGRVHGSTVPTGLLPTFPTTSMTWLGIMPRISVRYA